LVVGRQALEKVFDTHSHTKMVIIISDHKPTYMKFWIPRRKVLFDSLITMVTVNEHCVYKFLYIFFASF
jgi:hypothetical protein